MRAFYLIIGVISLSLGAVRAFLPLIPTVPLWLLATFCFAKSSDRLHKWTNEHPVTGAPILAWREKGAISRRSKGLATVSILTFFAVSVLLNLSLTILVIQAGVLITVLIFIWTRPRC